MIRRWYVSIGLLVLATGCVTVDATLRIDGSARILMLYRTPPDATEFLERARFTSPGVTVESVKIFEDQTTLLRLTVDDVTRLGQAKGFEMVDVGRQRAGTDERVTVTFRNPKPMMVPSESRPWLTVSATLPGPVRSANRNAAVLGSRLTWTVSRSDWERVPATVLTVRYTLPPP